jgi:TRAP-type transport system periplasmic protein
MTIKKIIIPIGSLGSVIILIFLSLLNGCSSPSGTLDLSPKTSVAIASAASAAPTVTPIVLKYAPSTTQLYPQIGASLTILNQVNLIENLTNGRLKIEIYWSETLARATELTAAVNSGLVDIAEIRPYGESNKLPLSTVGEMPGISKDLWALLYAYYDLSKQDPLVSEMAKYKMRPIGTFLSQENQLISKVPIRTIADLKGKKVSAGGIGSDILKSLGAVPVNMSPVDQNQGLLQGVIDAILAPIDAMYAFKFYEFGKYVTNFSLGPRIQPIVINQDSWNRLPPDIQKTIIDAAPKMNDLAYTSILNDTNEVVLKTFASSNVEFINFNSEDQAKINQALAAYGETWAENQERVGLSGKKVLSDYKNLAAKYAKVSPYKR